ncbi:hypothetical protein HI914_06866 [Erysiphe necator]|uniref:Uncharacterized protein n=1 Tax=Uncinula necator TaxID=52586 RepID=A0A0B1PC02_UNCNE|nr:hypothetical protein HI914_06866 [Erysiphe necator]KHJ34189.1 hypothetical protein EV44_g5635 [Erysiphe necator]
MISTTVITAARNVSNFCDEITSKTRIMKIFIKVEFGVTFSGCDGPHEPSVECRFIKGVKAATSKLQNSDDDNTKLKGAQIPPSIPWIRPLDLSGPFDKEQQDLWIMQILGSYNLSPTTLQLQVRPSTDAKPQNNKTNDSRVSFDTGVVLNEAKDIDLFQKATLTLGTFYDDSDSDFDCEKPWIFPCSDDNFSSGNFNLSIQNGKTPKKAKRYGMYRNLTTLW